MLRKQEERSSPTELGEGRVLISLLEEGHLHLSRETLTVFGGDCSVAQSLRMLGVDKKLRITSNFTDLLLQQRQQSSPTELGACCSYNRR